MGYLLAVLMMLPVTTAKSARTETLPNGLRVILVPIESHGESHGLVTWFSVVRTGSRDEVEPGKSGFAHFFEHMMFRGTKRHPAAEYDRILTTIGASRNAFTNDDFTAYYATFSSEDLETVVDLESDRFQNLEYDEAAFQTEAGAVYGEYRKNITQPEELLDEKLHDLAFDVHTYKHTTIGFERDIQAMPQGFAYSRSFFERFYRPDNVTLLVVGDVDPKRTMALIHKRYDGWRKGYTAPDVRREPPQTKERSGEVSYPGRTLPILDLAYKGEAFDAGNRRYVAAVLLGELAFGETSELYQKLYLNEQKVQRLTATVPMSRDAPLFEIQAVVKAEADLGAVQGAIEAAIADAARHPVDAQRLRDIKRRWKYQLLMSFDSTSRTAAVLVRYIGIAGNIDVIDELLASIDKVTAEDIMDAARTYYTRERRTVMVLKGARS